MNADNGGRANYDLMHFTIREMSRCGRAIRTIGEDATSMEETADRIVRHLYRGLTNGEGEQAAAMVRLFITLPFRDLDQELQGVARRSLGGDPPSPEMRSLVLLATAGDQPHWNTRRDSQGHQAIPLPNAEAVHRAPMVSNLITQMGHPVEMIIEPAPEVHLDMEHLTLNVFYVPEALGSAYIPAQKEFVAPFGIRSGMGFGGFLPKGEMYAVVLFLKVPPARETVDLFKSLSLNVKMALLPFMDRIFADPAQVATGSPSRRLDTLTTDVHALQSRITAMEQLIGIYEKTVIEQANKLYGEILRHQRDEEEIRRLNAELRQKIAELEDAQEALVRKEKLAILGQLSGSVAHELRNPLGVILNAVLFLEMTLANADESVKEYLEIIKQEIDGSLEIIGDLLDFARTKPPLARIVSAQELIDQSLGKCQIPDCVTVKVELAESLPWLKIDPLQMGQVLQNLIMNGVQAMPAGGELRVHAGYVDSVHESPIENMKQRTGNSVVISVEDSGEGISPENMKKIFQPLFTTKARGIGLGLVTCRNLTENNGGRIEVKSELGKGSTFSTILPVGRDKV